jgi:hypothetical protein
MYSKVLDVKCTARCSQYPVHFNSCINTDFTEAGLGYCLEGLDRPYKIFRSSESVDRGFKLWIWTAVSLITGMSWLLF